MRPASGEDAWLSQAREALWRVPHIMGGGGGQMKKPE